MLVSPPPFLDTYIRSTWSQGCKALCIVMRFLVLWAICWSYSPVDFKNSPYYLKKRTALEFIPLMRFWLCNFASRNFLVLPRYIFKKFLSSPLVWWCLLPIFPSICMFPFLRTFVFCFVFSWFGSSILSVMCLFPLLIIRVAHFSSQIIFLCSDCKFSPVSNSFSFLASSLMSSMCIRWLIFSCNLPWLFPPAHFWSVWLRHNIDTTNSNRDSASPWNIPL